MDAESNSSLDGCVNDIDIHTAIKMLGGEDRVEHHYRVIFSMYQYNSGAGDNGSYQFSEDFDTKDEALDFCNDLVGYYREYDVPYGTAPNMSQGHRDLVDRYIYHGYVNRMPEMIRVLRVPMDIEGFEDSEDNQRN